MAARAYRQVQHVAEIARNKQGRAWEDTEVKKEKSGPWGPPGKAAGLSNVNDRQIALGSRGLEQGSGEATFCSQSLCSLCAPGVCLWQERLESQQSTVLACDWNDC